MSIAGECSRMRHYFAQRIVETSQYLETWREPGPTQAGLTIAAQSRINREPIADFVDMFLRIELIWAGRLWTLLFWFFFAIGYHYWTQCLGKPEYSVRLNCNMSIMPYNIDVSSYNGRFWYNKCLPQSRTNRRSTAMQGFTIANAEIHMPFHNS